MSVTERWSALGHRLDTLMTIYDRFCGLPSDSVVGSQEKALLNRAVELALKYIDLRTDLESSLGTDFPAIDRERMDQLVKGALDGSVRSQRSANLAELLILLSFLRNDIDALMSDGQEAIRSRAERAFLHLQWSIAANNAVQTEWKSAFEKHETACEALGAAHMLSHGIYAFKATSTKARTDLVFHDPIDTMSADAVADGLVLTEWKLLRTPSKLDEIVSSAAEQADMYSAGVLGGRELRRVRYIIVVSCEQITMPLDLARDNYLIRHVNIAVQPKSPSAAAPDLAKARK